MNNANKNAVHNLCPPSYTGEEVAADMLDSDYFIGSNLKNHSYKFNRQTLFFDA